MHPRHHTLPQLAHLLCAVVESPDSRTFTFGLQDARPAFDDARPGQFVMLSVFGHGEAAFTLSSLPSAGGRSGEVVLTVRRVGSLTTALFDLPVGARVGLRGPFGRGFPDGFEVPTLFVAGGCGLSPLKAAIDTQIARRDGAPIAVLYGARDPQSRIHRQALAAWSQTPAVRVIECVEHPTPDWKGAVGILGVHLDEAVQAAGARRAAVCGPPAMLGPVAFHLLRTGIPADGIHLALERYMKCGTRECGHCYVNHRYVCTDGPVFSLAELERLPDAFGDPADTWSASCH